MRSPGAPAPTAIVPPLRVGAADVWTIALDVGEAERVALAELLAPEERARAARLRLERARRRFVASHAALRQILAAYLGVAPQAVAIEVDRQGKPRLSRSRHPRGPRFNLSHSGEVALVAVSLHEVGVDVEATERARDADALVRRYFAPAENEAYFALPQAARPAAFLAAWTAKEAYLKGCGDGLARDLASFTVSMPPDAPARLLAVTGRRGHESRWRLARLAVRPGYVGTLAIAAPVAVVRERPWRAAVR
jgi:4'-phosphopantetheinyl transferase